MRKQTIFKFSAIALAVASIAACSGGGGTSTNPSAPLTSVTGAVIDGRIVGATVCLDLNANQACDANEPSAVTDSAGDYKLNTTGLTVGNVTAAHLLVQVPDTAKDLDDGGLTLAQAGKSAFTMMAPGNASGVVTVTPFTTVLSQALINDPSQTNEQAIASALDTLGLPSGTDLFQDPSKGNTTIRNTARAAAATLGVIQASTGSGSGLSPAQIGNLTAQQFRQNFGSITQQANMSGGTNVNISEIIRAANTTMAAQNITSAASTLGAPVDVTAAFTGGIYGIPVSNFQTCALNMAAPAPSAMMARAAVAGDVTKVIAPMATAALPAGFTLTNGSGTVTVNGNVMTINQATQVLEVNWNDFSIAAGSSVIVNQPSASSKLINRVVTSNRTEIYGSLIANGEVEIKNANGTAILGGSAVLNASALTLNFSTVDTGVAISFNGIVNLSGVSNITLIGSSSGISGINLGSNLGTNNVSYFGNTSLLGTSTGSGGVTLFGSNNSYGGGNLSILGTSTGSGGVFLGGGSSSANVSLVGSTNTSGPSINISGPTFNTSSPPINVSGPITFNGSGPGFNTSGPVASVCTVFSSNKKQLSNSKLTQTVYLSSSGTVFEPYTATGSGVVWNELSPTGAWVVPSGSAAYTVNSAVAGTAVNDNTFSSTRYSAKGLDISGWAMPKVRGLEAVGAIKQATFPAGSMLYWLTTESSADTYGISLMNELLSTSNNTSYANFSQFVADHQTSGGIVKAVSTNSLSGARLSFDTPSGNAVTFWNAKTGVSSGTGTYEYRSINGQQMLVISGLSNGAYVNAINADGTLNPAALKMLPFFAFKNGKLYGGQMVPKRNLEDLSTPYFNKAAAEAIRSKLGWGALP